MASHDSRSRVKKNTTFKCAKCPHMHVSETFAGAMVKAKMHWANTHGGIPDRAEEVIKEGLEAPGR